MYFDAPPLQFNVVFCGPEPLRTQLDGTVSVEFVRNVPEPRRTKWFVPQAFKAVWIVVVQSAVPLLQAEARIVDPDCVQLPEGIPPGMPAELQSTALCIMLVQPVFAQTSGMIPDQGVNWA